MSEPHPHVALARRAWEAMASSDIAALREVLSPEIIWHATGSTPWAGNHQGFEAVLDYLALVGENTDSFDAQLEDVLVSRQRALLLFDATFTVAERLVEVRYALLAQIEGETVREVWTVPLDPSVLSCFWN